MRWTHEPPPKKGDIRTRSGFLWWPKTIAGQTRWLERATWMQGVYYGSPGYYEAVAGLKEWLWFDAEWVDG